MLGVVAYPGLPAHGTMTLANGNLPACADYPGKTGNHPIAPQAAHPEKVVPGRGKKHLKIGLITTRDTNLGDDLIRSGVQVLLQNLLPEHSFQWVLVNKHTPYEVYPRWHPIHWRHLLESGKGWQQRLNSWLHLLSVETGLNRLADCDMIVNCGAPVVFPQCHQMEWSAPLWYQVLRKLHRSIPILNLAAGSCFPWTQQPSQVVCPGEKHFLQCMEQYSRRITARDPLAARLLDQLGGKSTPVIPCAALLHGRHYLAMKPTRQYILVNYMQGGGHYDWNQQIDAHEWAQRARKVMRNLGQRHKVAFLCHTAREVDLARELAPEFEVFHPRTPEEFCAVAQWAKAGICNRLHAAVGLASFGIPSVAVGTDTRMLMVQEIGLPVFYVPEATITALEETVEDFCAHPEREKEKLRSVQDRALAQYEQALGPVLAPFRG